MEKEWRRLKILEVLEGNGGKRVMYVVHNFYWNLLCVGGVQPLSNGLFSEGTLFCQFHKLYVREK